MSNKKLIMDALQCRETPRAPWLPYVGVHGANLLGVSAADYLHRADLIVRGQQEAAVRYQADGVPVVFDLQLEAEVLDADWCGPMTRLRPWRLIPRVPCAEVIQMDSMDFHAGRLPVAAKATRGLADALATAWRCTG